MYLSKLELHGFKSFASRTVIDFSDGVTAVVGPNGCGKSNIVDAVRWVIGEQRARILRSEKMENVIFNGTAKRRPLGMAEVLLTIENTRGVLPTEYTEVTIGRRLYRSGESDYLLNGVQCRLRDITDLFMDTGMGAGAYSVIELKMIEQILSDNALDRRRLFEEAAGITKYKRRRDQTLRKLDTTQADLTRLRDLTEELDKRVRSLKRQAKAAARYKEAEARLHELELLLAQAEFDRLATQQGVLKAEIQALQDRVEGETARQAQAEAQLEALHTEHIAHEQALTARQQTSGNHLERLRALQADARLEQERLDGALRDQERTRKEQGDDHRRRSALAESIDGLEGALARAEPALESATAALQEAREARDAAQTVAEAHRQTLQSLRQQEHRATDARADRQRDLDRNASRLELLGQDLDRVQAQLATLSTASEGLAGRVQAAAERLEDARQHRDDARNAASDAETTHTERRQALDDALVALHQAERRRDAAAAEAHLLKDVLASYEDLSEAVHFLSETPSWTTEPLRTVADVLACDEADRLALDAALGDLAACIVVQTEAEARAALATLNDHEKGRATFVVLDRLPAVPPSPPHPQEASPMDEHVRVAAPAYEPLATWLLHGCYLVASLDEAPEEPALPYPSRFFTRSGEWTDTRGLLHGGSPQQGPSRAGSRLGLDEKRRAAQEALAQAERDSLQQADAVEAGRAALTDVPLEATREALHTATKTLNEAEQQHNRVQYEQETSVKRQEETAERAHDLRTSLDAGQAARLTLEQANREAQDALNEARAGRTEAEDAFQAAEAESRATLSRFNEANIAFVQAQNRCDNLRHDLEQTEQRIADLDRQAEARASLLETLATRIETARQNQATLHDEIVEARTGLIDLDAAVDEAKAVLMETKANISSLEADLREIRRRRELSMREETQRSIRLAEVGTRAEDLLHNIREDFGRSLLDDPLTVPDDFEEREARDEVQKLRQKIRTLGPVNALALEAYEEERQRLAFLDEQLQDLESAESTLLQTIDEINTTASRRFHETFDLIQANFARLFGELFGDEAAATLVLEDPDDPLESAIEIMAKPRGKRPSVLNQLSGGEKTLTATALLFAIYLVKPSPFCILDEVDAPLDDANIGRFMQLIRAFADSTQFILVTHNKKTMEAADCMYGVTMQEQGVSKLVGVKFDEAVELAEA